MTSVSSPNVISYSDSRQALVLFVDDDEQIRKLMKAYLEKQHFDVITAANGLEGLRVFQNNDAIRVVVTDLDMPVMRGDAMIREVLKINPNVNVIVASADIDPDAPWDGGRPSNSLAKPYDPDELAKAVRALL